MRCRAACAFVVCATLSIAADDQPASPELKARQLYYKKAPATNPASNTPQASGDENKPPASKKTVRNNPKLNPKKKSTEQAENTPAAEPPSGQTSGPSSTPAPPSVPESELPRLGLRYSVRMGSKEVDSQQVFRSGERFRLSLRANEPAYVYVVMKQSQGDWQPLFPSPSIENNNNYVAGGQEIVIPGEQEFFFDDHPGQEKLVVVVSRQPERDLERLVDAVRRQSEGSDPTRVARKSEAVLSQNVNAGIPNDELQRYRGQFTSRGILVGPNPKKSNGYPEEKAVYVVNAAAREELLIADIILKHR